MLSTIEYPHWLMLAGAVLVLAGLVGWAFQRNRQAAEVREAAAPETDQPAVEGAASAKPPSEDQTQRPVKPVHRRDTTG
ncbi:hypothetical protein Bra1253DRAFT_00438 [Bradyrhizobium sp. WSM1253]|nr:hypothetical protein Bra1253DRAFT_00438 [Bradyrhizobium sp. WSM1253]